MSVDISVTEVHSRAFQLFASEIQRDFFLLALLAGSVVYTQMVEFFCDGFIHFYSPSISITIGSWCMAGTTFSSQSCGVMRRDFVRLSGTMPM